jgi:hypothetical protein
MKKEWQKSPAGTRSTDGKNLVWFEEIERKLAKLSKTTFTRCVRKQMRRATQLENPSF